MCFSQPIKVGVLRRAYVIVDRWLM